MRLCSFLLLICVVASAVAAPATGNLTPRLQALTGGSSQVSSADRSTVVAASSGDTIRSIIARTYGIPESDTESLTRLEAAVLAINGAATNRPPFSNGRDVVPLTSAVSELSGKKVFLPSIGALSRVLSGASTADAVAATETSSLTPESLASSVGQKLVNGTVDPVEGSSSSSSSASSSGSSSSSGSGTAFLNNGNGTAGNSGPNTAGLTTGSSSSSGRTSSSGATGSGNDTVTLLGETAGAVTPVANPGDARDRNFGSIEAMTLRLWSDRTVASTGNTGNYALSVGGAAGDPNP
jgi:hypothetical protein